MMDAVLAVGGTAGTILGIWLFERSAERTRRSQLDDEFEQAAEEAIALTRLPKARRSIDDTAGQRQ